MGSTDGTPERAADGELAILTNREPYSHGYDGDSVAVQQSRGGLAIALDGAMQELGGTWIAWGSGDADFEVADDENEVALPPGEDDYRLRRLRLDRAERENYYYGYSNQVLWPLCHADTDHVELRPGYWEAYRSVNERFARAAVDAGTPSVWLHDYHLLLAPERIRRLGSEARVAFFMHIPWPATEQFRICPHTAELLRGVLGADAVGFHIERYARNFLAAADTFLDDAAVDFDAGTVTRDGRVTTVYASPLGIDADQLYERATSEAAETGWRALARRHGLDADVQVGVSVDRLDYTKGILERLDALEHLFETRPDLRGEFTLVQKGTRTRHHIPSYRRYHRQVQDRVYELNDAYATDEWAPVVYVKGDLSNEALAGLYRHADVGIVSSRRDGMNLVAKEFVAASAGRPSALVLSEFAGAATQLAPPAIGHNPYDIAGAAAALAEAIEMSDAERRRRTETLVERVRNAGIGEWLDEQLTHLGLA